MPPRIIWLPFVLIFAVVCLTAWGSGAKLICMEPDWPKWKLGWYFLPACGDGRDNERPR